MDRYVIKGRGDNGGMYLSYAHKAGLPPDDGFIWLPGQRNAARWDDPRRPYAARVARDFNGYFVKLVAPAPVVALVPNMRETISARAAGAVERPACHWFDGDLHDSGDDFCLACAQRLVDQKHAADSAAFDALYDGCTSSEQRYREAIDGGWDTDHDSVPRCATCGAKLSGHLTEYGADQELEALTGDAAPAFDDVEWWADLGLAAVNLADDDPWWRQIARVVESATEDPTP